MIAVNVTATSDRLTVLSCRRTRRRRRDDWHIGARRHGRGRVYEYLVKALLVKRKVGIVHLFQRAIAVQANERLHLFQDVFAVSKCAFAIF